MEKILSERKVEGESDEGSFDYRKEVMITNSKNTKVKKRKQKSANTTLLSAKETTSQNSSSDQETQESNDKSTSDEIPQIHQQVSSSEELLMSKELFFKERRTYYACLLLVTVVSFATRFYNIDLPRHVCYDYQLKKHQSEKTKTEECQYYTTLLSAKETTSQNSSSDQETQESNDKSTSDEIPQIHQQVSSSEELLMSKELFFKERRTYYACLLLVTVVSFATRFYNIDLPRHVCWDETHFGKMGSWYINRTFFFDVHPPLGKMLIGLSGYLTGYNGSFPFNKPGDEYGDTEYVGMRMFCATLGALLVPLSYSSVWLLTKSLVSSIIAASFVLCGHNVRVVSDKDERRRIITACHDGLGESSLSKALGGHFGRDKTIKKVAERFYWPGMSAEITSYIRQCDTCQRVQAPFRKTTAPLQNIDIPAEPWNQLGIDLLGPLPETEEGYKYIVTVIDYFTKWPEAAPLKEKSAVAVASFLYTLICRHGCPKVLISDQGREFVNEVQKELHKLTGVDHRMTSAYHPQANGLVERQNQTTQRSLLKHLEDKQDGWANILDGVLFAYRTSVHASTDIGTLTLSRHILLDPILMFFIMLSVYCKLKFLSHQSRPFSMIWWFWLAATGFALACSIGVKFVGLFIILHTGLTTGYDLWNLLKNNTLKMGDILKHFIGRAVCLIALPVAVYLIFFAIHFKILNKSGTGDGFYSSGFQAQLGGNKLYNVSMPENIAYGSFITLKQRRTGGAYLHSHWHLYPEEYPPRQQQVTTYSHKDENNVWIIKPATRNVNITDPPELVKAGDLIRLEHVPTRRNLHAHREPAPLTKPHYQVSCYGVNGTGDANDIWIVEVIGAAASTPVQTVRSKLKLIHYHVRCGLQSHDKKLPKWGWEQLEVTCNPDLRSKKILWSIEEVIDKRLPNVSFDVYSPTLFEKFMESHAVMTQGNSGLKPKDGEVTSRPWQWPITYRGQIFSGGDHRIYLLGNPVLFWAVIAVIGLFLLMILLYSIRKKRGVKVHPELEAYREKIFGACWWLLLGWAFHYLPFWPMTRVLYFHHYFPAYLFGAMLSGVVLDYFITMLCINVPDHLEVPVFHLSLGSILAAVVGSFYLFHPLTYGTSGPMAAEEGSALFGLKWLESWEF